jgi:hypothetical protein
MMPFASSMPGLGCGYGQGCYDAGTPAETVTQPAAPVTSGAQTPTSPAVLAPLPAGQGAAPYYLGYAVQPVSYYPGYVPTMNYWNPMTQVPYYWNPMGGR